MHFELLIVSAKEDRVAQYRHTLEVKSGSGIITLPSSPICQPSCIHTTDWLTNISEVHQVHEKRLAHLLVQGIMQKSFESCPMSDMPVLDHRLQGCLSHVVACG